MWVRVSFSPLCEALEQGTRSSSKHCQNNPNYGWRLLMRKFRLEMALLASVFKSCILEFRVISFGPKLFLPGLLSCLSVPRFNRSFSGNGYLKTATTNVKCSQSQRCVSVVQIWCAGVNAGYPLQGDWFAGGCAKRRKPRCKLLFLALTWLDVTHRFIVLLSLNTCVFSCSHGRWNLWDLKTHWSDVMLVQTSTKGTSGFQCLAPDSPCQWRGGSPHFPNFDL